MNLKKIVVIIISLVLVAALTSCVPRKRLVQPDKTINQVKEHNKSSGINKNAQIKQIKEKNSRIKKIEREIERIKQVRSASVIIIDNSVIVGVKIPQGLETKMTFELKREIEKKVREIQSSINNVTVTADPELIERIKEISDQTAAGEPVIAYTREIAEILRLIPQSK